MYIIGITGGVGAGKSEIIKYLEAHYDAFVAKADELGHLALARDEACHDQIVKLLGRDVIDENYQLDRGVIASKVYADEELLEQLNAIVHPVVESYIKVMISMQKKQNRKYFFVEAALLLEADYDDMCDETWYIYASEEVRSERLNESRHYTDEKIRQIMGNQLSEAQFEAKCDFTIDNSKTFEETKKQIESRMQKYENV